jgi:hypothetical protein
VEDYWRVLQESENGATPGPDRLLEAREDALDMAPPEPDPAPVEDTPDPRLETLALSVSLPPGYVAQAGTDGLLAAEGLAVGLAVYAKLLGPDDDSYPDVWRDPATGALPTMQQLAALAEVSLPTLRKRRDAAIARLEAAFDTKRGRDA